MIVPWYTSRAFAYEYFCLRDTSSFFVFVHENWWDGGRQAHTHQL